MKKFFVIGLVVFSLLFSGCVSNAVWEGVNNDLQKKYKRERVEREYLNRHYQKNYPSSYGYNKRCNNRGKYKCGKEK